MKFIVMFPCSYTNRRLRVEIPQYFSGYQSANDVPLSYILWRLDNCMVSYVTQADRTSTHKADLG
jgi:hypothetical protein